MSTIYALSSGTGRAGVAVVRVSGPATRDAVRRIAGDVPLPRRASLRRLRDGAGETIDHGLVLWLPSPGSFTGEDSAEFQTHGSRAVVAALFDALAQSGDCRPAAPGEFARRAFVNGRADLIELEAVADLIDAETQAQRRMALRQETGGLRGLVEGWAKALSLLLADAEADLDFSDEDDVEVDLAGGCKVVAALAEDMRRGLASSARADALREGFSVALVGPPNAGKSSLLNVLAGHDVAIVSDIPGTTRDALEIGLDIEGLPVRVIDTAGLRATEDVIEGLGVARAWAASRRADLTIWMAVDAPPPAEIEAGIRLAAQRDRFGNVPLPVWADHGVSINLPKTIDGLLAEIGARARAALHVDATMAINDRQRRLIESAIRHCMTAATHPEPELFAEDIRQARLDLARVTGRIAPSDVLDLVFGRFCIGK